VVEGARRRAGAAAGVAQEISRLERLRGDHAALDLRGRTIERAVGGPTRWFRAPGCRYSPEILQILNDLDMIRVDTTLNSGDWAKPDSKAIVDRIVKDVAPGDVILVHDRLALTVKALRR
jgi:peptidoglycan/xylan/chitin deacetylase (PgdA/CDA1 family)